MTKSVTKLTYSTMLRLKAVPLYDFALTVHKPAGWPLLTPYEIFHNGTLWTAMRTSGELFGLKLRSVGTVKNLDLSCKAYTSQKLGTSERSDLSRTVEWMLNLREDIKQFYALAKNDLLVKILVKDLYGMRNTKQPDIFSRLILAVTLQMAPIARSNQMMNLLIHEYGERIRFDEKDIVYWPSPKSIANAGVEELRAKCKLGYRAATLKGLAEAILKGFPSPQELEKMPAQEAKTKLMELKGIGEYSADIVSSHPGFALDVWSAKIFSMLILGKKTESPRNAIPNLKTIAEQRWGRWRGYVFFYVLQDLKNLSRRLNLNLTKI
jgi:DNA-3-methyladenine glycosylase II